MHPKQVKILDYIADYQQHKPFPPTYREIGEFVGCSASNVLYNLRELQDMGKVRLYPRTSRGIELITEDEAS